jgi:hypothetical protein
MTRSSQSNCVPKKYPNVAISRIQAVALKKLNTTNLRQGMRSVPASGPATIRNPAIKQPQKIAEPPWAAKNVSPH